MSARICLGPETGCRRVCPVHPLRHRKVCRPLSDLVQLLSRKIGADNVLSESADRLSYSYDGTYLTGTPDVVAFPRSTDDVVAVMHIAREHKVPVFTRGSGTGLSGGSIPRGGIALVMTRMNRILEVDRKDMLARVQPGVLTADLHKAAAAVGLFYPPDPGSARISTIGGNIAENAGGPRSFQYGTTDKFVLGLEVVLIDGTVLRLGGRTTKNVTGYNLTGLFVGSEGTLGVVTEATLRLLPPPPPAQGTLVASFPDLNSLGAAIGALAASPARPTSIEFLDSHCLAVLESHRPPEVQPGAAGALLCEVFEWPEAMEGRLNELTTLCSAHGATAVTGVMDEGRQKLIWDMRSALSPATARLKPTKISEDATVPVGAIPEFLAELENIRSRLRIDLMVFGHAGDGNFHPNLICDERDEDEMGRIAQAIDEIFAAAVHFRGTLSGEHGIGLLKLPYMKDAIEEPTLETMRRLKQFFDPDNLLNPGKLLPEPDTAPSKAGPEAAREAGA